MKTTTLLYSFIEPYLPHRNYDVIRRNTRSYRKKRQLVWRIWGYVILGIIVSFVFLPALIFVLILQTIFVSFIILDETEQEIDDTIFLA